MAPPTTLLEAKRQYNQLREMLEPINDCLAFKDNGEACNPSEKTCQECLEQLRGVATTFQDLLTSNLGYWGQRAKIDAHWTLGCCILHVQTLNPAENDWRKNVVFNSKIQEISNTIFSKNT
jgi:hypothetical protein